jgi:hypothetical protein
MKNFLSEFPNVNTLMNEVNGLKVPSYREANCHIHTPWSFSAFSDMETIFRMAVDEGISILGINDFYVTSGYDDFHAGCLANGIFPLFNLEFIGLLKEEQKKGIRINDPNNPGRIYFTGKGLDYPFHTGWFKGRSLDRVVTESQNQMKAMIGRLNELIVAAGEHPVLTYDRIRNKFARDLVRERHLAKAVRDLAQQNFEKEGEQLAFIEKLYGGKNSKTGIANHAALENEIRSNLLKSGGAAFVEEDTRSFMELDKIIKIIIDSGGIPCYPVLLDDPSGKYTEYEGDFESLYASLTKLGVECIELIPGRNDIKKLKEFVEFFNEKGFIITFGTEHNTPELIPLTVTARGNTPLDESLKKIAWEGACIIAAHQYLRADGRQGYILPDGSHSKDQKQELFQLGRMVLEYYFKNK